MKRANNGCRKQPAKADPSSGIIENWRQKQRKHRNLAGETASSASKENGRRESENRK